MSETPTHRHELTLRPMDTGAGTWDGAAVFYLEGNDLLAFVADAPIKARQESATLIKEFIKGCLGKFKERLTTSQRELTALLLADLGTAVGQHLLLNGSGAAYAACAFVLVRGDSIFVLSIGDCAVYLVGDDLLRFSEATRVGGASVLSIFGSKSPKPEEFISGSYLGAAPRAFSQKDVTVLPNRDVRTLVLVSDGAEQQVGLDRLSKLLRSCATPIDLKAQFDELLTAPLIDDVTLLAVMVEPFIGGLERSLEDIQHRLNAMDRDMPKLLAPFSSLAEDLQLGMQTLNQDYQTSRFQTNQQLQHFEGNLKTHDGRVAQMGEQLEHTRQRLRELGDRLTSGQVAPVSSSLAGGDARRLNDALLAVRQDNQDLRSQLIRLKHQVERDPSVARNTRSHKAVLRTWIAEHASLILFAIVLLVLALAVYAVIHFFFTEPRVEPVDRDPLVLMPVAPQPTANNSTNNSSAGGHGRDQPVRERQRPY